MSVVLLFEVIAIQFLSSSAYAKVMFKDASCFLVRKHWGLGSPLFGFLQIWVVICLSFYWFLIEFFKRDFFLLLAIIGINAKFDKN